MEVNISTTALPEKNGTIKYLKGFPTMQSAAEGAGAGNELKGIFAFTFYTLPSENFEQWKHYIKGLQAYVDMVKLKEDNPFFGWKIVIYTDQQTHDYLKTDSIQILFKMNKLELLNDPDVTFAIVNWPYYEREKKGQVNGDVLRIMRFRAFFDFNKVPVFVRDADTLWVSKERHFDGDVNTILQWESNFYEGAKKQAKPYIFGTSVNYSRPSHQNTSKGWMAPFGAYAGLQSAFPGTPCFQTLDLWEKAVDYVLTRSEYIETTKKFKNNKSVGKDEQILLYVFLPGCFDSIFFFELYMSPFETLRRDLTAKEEQLRILILGLLNGDEYHEEKYPSHIFSGSKNKKAAELETHFRTVFSKFLPTLKGGRRKQTRKQKHKRYRKTKKVFRVK